MRPEEISRPDKPLFGDGTTKLDLARYYDRIAPALLPHVRDRPLNLERYPDGISGRALFTQAAPSHFPPWIRRATTPKKGGVVEHVVAERADTLVYLAGQACITLHAWQSRIDRLDRPDRLIIDLDPSIDDFGAVRRAALATADLYRELGLVPFALVTGSRGIHVVAPLQRRYDHAEVHAVAKGIAAVLEEQDPDHLTTEFSVAKRGERIYLDAGRVRYGHTAVAPYSVRARDHAPVATPVTWDEVADDRLRPDGFTIRDVPARVERDGDAWADIAAHATGLASARRALGTPAS